MRWPRPVMEESVVGDISMFIGTKCPSCIRVSVVSREITARYPDPQSVSRAVTHKLRGLVEAPPTTPHRSPILCAPPTVKPHHQRQNPYTLPQPLHIPYTP